MYHAKIQPICFFEVGLKEFYVMRFAIACIIITCPGALFGCVPGCIYTAYAIHDASFFGGIATRYLVEYHHQKKWRCENQKILNAFLQRRLN
jgi:hypothetical protein